jgi:hypothetical protein
VQITYKRPTIIIIIFKNKIFPSIVIISFNHSLLLLMVNIWSTMTHEHCNNIPRTYEPSFVLLIEREPIWIVYYTLHT